MSERPMVRRLVTALVAVGVVLVAASGVAAWMAARVYQRPFKGFPEAERFVEIREGSSVVGIAAELTAAGAIRHPWLFRAAVWRQGAEQRLQAGEYRFDRAATVEEVVARLVRGDVHLRPLTIREGLTIDEAAEVYQARGFGSAADFAAAARDSSLVAALDPAAGDLEGYLFPETYALSRQSTAHDLIRQMVSRFVDVLTPELRATIEARGLTVRQAITVASLVEKETSLDHERPLVAAVYLTRLERGMLLQCDPTVIYALRLEGRYDGNIRRADLQLDSPYNTYRYPGLPPGPIAAPGRASIEAVASPADVDYLYFVSRNDGSHAFARTLDEHNRNVFEYQIRFFRERRGRS